MRSKQLGCCSGKPETRNPNLEARNPKPETRNPKPETRNPKPETAGVIFFFFITLGLQLSDTKVYEP
jgi:hypothetical protein